MFCENIQFCILLHSIFYKLISLYLGSFKHQNDRFKGFHLIHSMLKEKRFNHILDELKTNGQVLYGDLANELGVSEDTIRRDIELLVKSGLMVKTRGGAISPNKNPLSFKERSGLFSEGKKRIALKAQQQLNQIRTLFLDGGSTTLAFASSLPIDSNLRIITNNLSIPEVLTNHKGVQLIILGGNYERNTQTTFGTQTCLEVQKFTADLYLMGTCAIDPKFGLTAQVGEDGEVKKMMIQSSRKTMALVNQEKLNTNEYFTVATLNEIDGIITDLDSDDKLLDRYRGFEIEIK